MNDPSIEAGETAADALGDFNRFLRSAGRLAVGRQVSALCLIGAVFVLPALTTRQVSTEFVWAYFATLTLTSLFGVGLERLAGIVAASPGGAPLSRLLAPVLSLRALTIPVVAVGLQVLLRFVGVELSPAAWFATLAWTVAGLFAPVLFGGLRTDGDSTTEPMVMMLVRAAQAAVLVGLAISGASVAVMVAAVALCEWIGVVVAARAVGQFGAAWGRWTGWRGLPLRQALALAGIEVAAIVNLRADLLLVGHILGAGPGATYGLLYRIVDGFNGAIGSAGLWLYAESANERDGGTDPRGIRARSLAVLPRFGLALAALVALAAGLVGAVSPRLSSEVDTLRILAIAFPILSVNVVELHVRSGRGRNREVLLIQAATVLVNVPLCIAAVHVFGLRGAAGVLVISELLLAGLLWVSAARDERALVGPAVATAVFGALLVLVTGVALGYGWTALAVLGVTGVIALVARPLPRRSHPQVPAS